MVKRNNDPGQNKIGLKTPSLHGNNSEFGAKEVNLILFWVSEKLTLYTTCNM